MDYPSDVMTDSERLPSNAVHEITWICHVVTSMWESGVLVGIVEYLDTSDFGAGHRSNQNLDEDVEA